MKFNCTYMFWWIFFNLIRQMARQEFELPWLRIIKHPRNWRGNRKESFRAVSGTLRRSQPHRVAQKRSGLESRRSRNFYHSVVGCPGFTHTSQTKMSSHFKRQRPVAAFRADNVVPFCHSLKLCHASQDTQIVTNQNIFYHL